MNTPKRIKVCIFTESDPDSERRYLQTWWRNFIRSLRQRRVRLTTINEGLQQYGGSLHRRADCIEFESEADFTMFLLRFS